MNIIKPKTVNFSELVKNSSTILSLDLQSELIDSLNEHFNQEEQRWFISNLYMYINYHPTTDFPINLEDVYKMVGFSTKANTMKSIKNNFTENDDYKIVFFRMEENLVNEKNVGGRPTENVMLNVDAFKNLCMIAKTENGKKIRKYYVKLETIYNELIKKQLIEQKLLLQIQIDINKTQGLLSREKALIECHLKQNVFYICLFKYEDKWYVKFGISEGSINLSGDIRERINSHKNQISKNLYLVHVIKIENCKELENRFKQNIVTIEKSFANNKIKTEIIEMTDTITIESTIKLAEKLSKIKPTFNLDLALAKEKTKQMEIQLEITKHQQIQQQIPIEVQQLIQQVQQLYHKQQETESEQLYHKQQETESEQQIETVSEQQIEQLYHEQLQTVQQTVTEQQIEQLKSDEELRREKHLESARLRQQKYRQSDKYKQKTQTLEFKERDNERRKTEHYKNQEKIRNQRPENILKQKIKRQDPEYKLKEKIRHQQRPKPPTKADIASSEKEKLFNWCQQHLSIDNSKHLVFQDFLQHYTPDIPHSSVVQKIYREHLELFIQQHFPTINSQIKRFEIDTVRINGWKNISLNF